MIHNTSIGMRVGAGLYVTGIFAMLLLLGSLVIIGNVEQRVGLHTRTMNFRVTAQPRRMLLDAYA